MKRTTIYKKIISAFIIISVVLSFTGCSPQVNLTEEESKIISEYAAGLLLKYDKNYSGKLVKVEEPKEDPDAMKVVKEKAPAAPYEEPGLDAGDATGSTTGNIGESENNTYSSKSLSETLSADGFEITYNGFEAKNIFPEEEKDEPLFSLQAQEGMELLVLHFNITNNGDSEKLCNIISNGAKYRIIINDSERVNSMKTILLNDLEQYYDVIAGYGMVDSVLVFEVAEGTAQNINSLDLIITTKDGNERFKLQ